MNAAEIVGVLEQKFGPRIKGKKLEAIDPSVAVDAADPARGLPLLEGRAALAFDLLNCITGVDYLETDPTEGSQSRLRAAPRGCLSFVQLYPPAPLRRGR